MTLHWHPVGPWTKHDERVAEFIAAGLSDETAQRFARHMDELECDGDQIIATAVRCKDDNSIQAQMEALRDAIKRQLSAPRAAAE